VLARRQLTPSKDDDARIEACMNFAILERWLERRAWQRAQPVGARHRDRERAALHARHRSACTRDLWFRLVSSEPN
jgi:hypothetical protein